MVKRIIEDKWKHVTGKVKFINVKGHGPNSGHMQFVVSGKAFLLTGPPKQQRKRTPEIKNDGYEPYLFNAMANLIIAAYYQNDSVTVAFEEIEGTNFPREISPEMKITAPKVEGGGRTKKSDE